MKGKVKLTVTAIIDVDTEHFPGAKTIKDCAKMQEEYCKDGTASALEILEFTDTFTINIEAQ